MDKDQRQMQLLALEYLKFFGNTTPTLHQKTEMEMLLSNLWLSKNIIFDVKLSKRENICLYLAAQGKSIEETSQLLGITIDTVKAYRKAIIRKLSCKNIPHAVSLGIRYGHINLSEIT